MNKLMMSISILFLFSFIQINAQTVNAGELVIKSSTELSTLADFNNTISGDLINDGTLTLYANFNNDGIVSFTPALTTGLTYFKGNLNTQTISGSMLSELNNVKFENNSIQPAFFLSGDVSVSGTSDFYYGIIDNVNYPGSFTFEENGSHRDASNNSYVWGYVEKNQNGSFEFPIGDGGFFRPNELNYSDSGNFSGSRYFLKNSNDLYPHNKKDPQIQLIDKTEYWELQSNQTFVNAALTLSWDEETTPDEIINPTPGTEIAIVNWSTTENKWKYYTTAVDPANKIATASISNDGIFTLAVVLAKESDDIVVFNAVSPNGDGKNDYLKINGLSNYPNNRLQIYNRWGVKVYDTTGYGLNNNFFTGFSEGRTTVDKTNPLPAGTYFYVLTYQLTSGNWKDKTGYLYMD